jgi:hypothetical protein
MQTEPEWEVAVMRQLIRDVQRVVKEWREGDGYGEGHSLAEIEAYLDEAGCD